MYLFLFRYLIHVLQLFFFFFFFFCQKGHFEDSVTISNLSPGMYKFRLTVTDDAGQTGSTEVSVLVLTPEQSLRKYIKMQQELCVYVIYLFAF